MTERVRQDSSSSSVPQSILRIDIADDPYKTLAALASRIEQLLAAVGDPGDPNVVGPLDDLLGAIYSLIVAAHHRFDDRPNRQIERATVTKRVEQVKEGNVRLDGKWIAGWHFNSALFRVAAVYHRLLKVVTGKRKGDRPELQRQAEALFRSWTGTDWSNQNVEAIYEQVNTLKHDSSGVYHAREATFVQGLAAVGEVLTLLEAWCSKRSAISRAP